MRRLQSIPLFVIAASGAALLGSQSPPLMVSDALGASPPLSTAGRIDGRDTAGAGNDARKLRIARLFHDAQSS
jgi:hypothetical protein